jgi:hypothetical protein
MDGDLQTECDKLRSVLDLKAESVVAARSTDNGGKSSDEMRDTLHNKAITTQVRHEACCVYILLWAG